MAKYTVYVARISYAIVPIKVEADSGDEAEATALDLAGDYLFSEHSAEYEVESVTEG